MVEQLRGLILWTAVYVKKISIILEPQISIFTVKVLGLFGIFGFLKVGTSFF
jgi:hypothetical protein